MLRTDARATPLLAERFRIDALMAEGGMADLCRGFDLHVGTPVALKLLRRRDEGMDQRFRSEAAMLSTFSHPAIVRYVHHAVPLRGTAFLAMEWLAGEDLSVRLERQGLTAAQCVAMFRVLCGALASVHARGVVHRDIKPSNVFLVDGEPSRVKLLDFGIACALPATTGPSHGMGLMGTVGYVAPEQARAASRVDARADVFALGCLFYECLTGTRAFAGEHDVAVLVKLLRDEPRPVSEVRPELGDAFDTLIASMLAKDPEARLPDAAAVLERVAALPGHAGEGAPAARAAPRSGPIADERRILSVVMITAPRDARADAAPPALDDDALREACAQQGSECLALQGGSVLALLAGSGAETAADQAMRAARCALRIRALFPALELAIATGEVMTRAGQRPVGAAIDRAAALLAASPGGAAISADALTIELLGARFAVEPTAWGARVVSEIDPRDGVAVLMGRSTPFVGRAKEHGLLNAMFDQCVEDGVCRAVLVTGPPGVGKSRLVRAVLAHVRGSSDARVTVAYADSMTARSALGVVQRLLRGAAGLRAGAPAHAQRAQLTAYLAKLGDALFDGPAIELVAELLEVGAQQPESTVVRSARIDPEIMREQKRRAFERWVGAELERGPMVLVLEDLHWGDLPSVNYLENVLRAFAKRPLFVMACARPEVHEHFPKLRELHGLDEVRLGGLTRRGSEQLAQSLLPRETDHAVLAEVVRMAGGNPLYLEELVRRVVEGGSELPATVMAIVRSRLERLPETARRALRAASVFGETAWAGGVEALLGPNVDVRSILSWLTQQELLESRASTEFPAQLEYGFRHALVREAAYAMLTDDDRRLGHQRAGTWLEAHGERDARVLADHFERACASARAIPWLQRAAAAALEGGDFESARALSRRGADLGAVGEQRGALLLVRAYASTWCCDPELPREALALLPERSPSWWLALSLHLFGCAILGTPADAYLAVALETSAGSELTSAYGHAMHVLATGAALLGRPQVGWASIEHFERSLQRTGGGEDAVCIAWFHLARCILASNSTMPNGAWALGDALRSGRTSIEAMRLLGSASGEAAALFHLGNAYWLAGDYAESLTLLRQARVLARATGNALVESHADLLLSVDAMRAGRHDEGRDHLARLATSANAQVAHGAAIVLADCQLREGKRDEGLARALEATRGGALMYRRSAWAIAARAHLAQHAYPDALAACDRAQREGPGDAFPHLTVELCGLRARALRGCGARDEAEKVIAYAQRFREATAGGIEDPRLRDTFRRRGQANRMLDALIHSSPSSRQAFPEQT